MTICRLRAGLILAAGWLTLALPAHAEGEPQPQLASGTLPANLEQLISSPPRAKKVLADAGDAQAAKAFYAARGYAPLWVTDSGFNANAQRAMGEIARADDWGLKAADFVLPAPLNAPATQDALAQSELMLTRAVLKYARYAKGGRIPDPGTMLSGFIDRKPQLIAPDLVLEQISVGPVADAYLRGLHPHHAGFETLRQAYLKERGGQVQFAALKMPPGATIKPGQTDPQVAILRKRLGVGVAVFPADVASPAEVYDPGLVAAVMAFQAKAGLRRPDGMVGAKTRAALNAKGEGHIAALVANMEQWRWMPEQLGETYVNVNIPEFEMRLVQSGRVVHRERVVTGKLETATPVFSADMQTVVFQPKWGVPDSIKINELLPRLQQGRGLRPGLRMTQGAHDVDPWNVDWSRADITRYQIYQPSGDDNALGIVKFLFPNKNSVYLHDTPTKTLFNATSRGFSHGCVRLRNPIRLAELVLGADKGWDSGRVRELAEDGPEDNAIKLDTKIPVHITYFTATADEAGNIVTFPDVYGHEKRITQALEGRADQIAKLNPLPLGSTRPAAVAGDYGDSTPRPRRTAEAQFAPPASLGYAPPPVFKGFFNFTPSKPSRGRGNSTNDIIMRQLGGF